MKSLAAVRITSGKRRGSSRPVVVDTEAGAYLVKLRGAAQGAGPLLAEISVAELAEALGLSVPSRALIELAPNLDVQEGADELADVLAKSVGVNLGFSYLSDARDLTPAQALRLSADDRAAILWLDRFVMNPDRTPRNPNLLHARNQTWLIDHGAALRFQYDWPMVHEDAPTRPSREHEPHLFAGTVSPEEFGVWDEVFASRISRDVLDGAVGEVPDTFLEPLVGGAGDVERRR